MTSKHGKHHTITDIVSNTYCEQKMIFDRTRGRVATMEVRAKQDDGIKRHQRFEQRGRSGSDRRCFIATAVYGPEAPETNFLRGWRDHALMARPLGRAFVQLYYRASPALVPLLERHARLAQATRFALGRVIRLLGFKS